MPLEPGVAAQQAARIEGLHLVPGTFVQATGFPNEPNRVVQAGHQEALGRGTLEHRGTPRRVVLKQVGGRQKCLGRLVQGVDARCPFRGTRQQLARTLEIGPLPVMRGDLGQCVVPAMSLQPGTRAPMQLPASRGQQAAVGHLVHERVPHREATVGGGATDRQEQVRTRELGEGGLGVDIGLDRP